MTHLTPLFIMMSLQANELFVVFTVVWCHDIPLVHVQPGAVCACVCVRSVCVRVCLSVCVCVCVRECLQEDTENVGSPVQVGFYCHLQYFM